MFAVVGCSSGSGITGKSFSPFSISESDDDVDESELDLELSLDELSLWLLNSLPFGCAVLCFNRRVNSKLFGKNRKQKFNIQITLDALHQPTFNFII